MHRYAKHMLCALAVAIAPLKAQELTGAAKWADSARKEIDAASLAGDSQRLANARTLLSRALVAFPQDGLLMHYQGFALYRALYLESDQSAAVTAARVDSARALLEKSLEKSPRAETYALLTAIYGRQISAEPTLGATLGMDIQSAAGKARTLGPNNPRVFLIAGEGAIFTPPEWGGGADRAAKLLARAVELYATDAPRAPEPSWGRAEAYVWLGQAQEKLGRKADALASYKTALSIEPNYPYARRLIAAATEK